MNICCCPREMENPPDFHGKRQRDTSDLSGAISHLVCSASKKQNKGSIGSRPRDGRQSRGQGLRQLPEVTAELCLEPTTEDAPLGTEDPVPVREAVMFLIFLKIGVQFKSVNTRTSRLRKILSEFI